MFALPYLIQENRRQQGAESTQWIHASDKKVVVLGGGDTGADCVATAHWQGARSVVQIGINPRLLDERMLSNPWPEQRLTYTQSYALEEGGDEAYSLDVTA